MPLVWLGERLPLLGYQPFIMADDFYEDGAVDSTETASSSERETDESETQTALLPISLCPGMEPGDTIRLRIVEVFEQDYSVEYVKEDEDDEEEVEETVTETVTSPMDEMMG